MEVHLSPELQAKVDRAAAENKSGAEEYVKQLVEHYVDHDAWFRQQVTKGLDQLDRGEFLTHEEVGARIDQTIYDSAGSLKSFPNKGRTGRVEGTRELALPPLPFVVVYRVLKDIVEIANVIHGAQKWPPKD